MSFREVLFTEQEVIQVLKRDFQKEDFQIVGFRLLPASEHPIGFLGDHGKLEVRITRETGNEKRIYFVKLMPDGNPTRCEYLRRIRCFHKEIGLYKSIFQMLENAAPTIPKWRPDCLFSREDQLLVLEDLTQDGYYMYPERELMDDEHVVSSLKALAAMHATSIVFEENHANGRGTIWEEFSPFLFETTASADKNHPGNAAQEAAIKAQLRIVDLLTGYSPQQKDEIKEKLPARMRRIFFLVKPSQKFRNVIVHGDLWSNNLMFVKDSNGKVKNAKMVDFQLARYAPPAHDIVTFLNLVQNRKYREENQMRLLQHYYEALSDCLKKEGLRPDKVLTWFELLGTCDYYEEFGLLTALFFFQLILTPPHLCKKFIDSPEDFLRLALVDRSDLVTESFRTDSTYRERVTETMKELIDEYIL